MTATATTAGAAADSVLSAVASGSGARARLRIGGLWTEAEGGGRFAVRSPATGEPVGTLSEAGDADTHRAIDAASEALPGWSARAPAERASLLLRAAELLESRSDPLARLIAMEGGKPITEARGEVGYAAGFLRFYASEAERALAPESHPGTDRKRVVTARAPAGVAGLITVWNFPAAGITRPLGAALAAGCTAVVKPAEQTPLSAVAVTESMVEAGLPPGAVNLITASDPEPVGSAMVASPIVRKLSFTGSTAVGKRLLRDSAAQLKRVTLELGGHAPFIVFADADLEAAVEGAVRSKFRNSGQTCICLNRLYVHEDVEGEFCERFRARVQALRVGDPLDGRTEVGPLIDESALAKVSAHVADALERGARLLCGGAPVAGPGAEAGLLFEPTALSGVDPAARVMREETFGPVAPIATFAAEDEVLSAANALPGGLAAFLYTNNRERADRVAERLQFGVIGVNDPLPAAPHLPFGGLKESGLGKEGGRLGIDEFTDAKLISGGA